MGRAPSPGKLPVVIREVAGSETVALRECVLWPGRPEMCLLPEDDEPHVLHLGAFLASQLDDAGPARGAPRGVLTLVFSAAERSVQLRKFCVAPPLQGRGVGRALLEAAIRCALAAPPPSGAGAESRMEVLRLDAREHQRGLYERFGFCVKGDPFCKYPHKDATAMYVVMEMRRGELDGGGGGSMPSRGRRRVAVWVAALVIAAAGGAAVSGKLARKLSRPR